MADFPKRYYGFIALTGGGQGSLDNIPGTNLIDKDFAFGTYNGKFYSYLLDVDSGLDEDPPNVISPDVDAGDKRWILQYPQQESRYMEVNLPAGSWNYPTSNPAPLERDTGTNGGMFVHAFDDTTEEFIILEPAFELPNNLDTSGTVYFSLFGYAKTADGNEVQFRIYHSAKSKGNGWDFGVYSQEDSGDYTTNASQDALDQIEWNETVANLGWEAGDLVRLKLSRIAINDGTPVSGDYYFCNLKIRIPVT